MPGTLHVSVVTPAREVLEEETSHASIPAHDGQVGLLPDRAPMLVKLGYGQMQLGTAGGQQQHYFIGGGFAQIEDNQLTVLTDEAMPLSELDGEQAQHDLNEALNDWAGTESEQKRRTAKTNRARAMLRLSPRGKES